jgi:hypothetical protein
VVTTVVGVFLGMFRIRQLLVAWSGGRPRWWPGLLVVVVCLVVVLLFELVIFLFLGSVAVVNWFCFGWVPDRVLLGWVT